LLVSPNIVQAISRHPLEADDDASERLAPARPDNLMKALRFPRDPAHRGFASAADIGRRTDRAKPAGKSRTAAREAAHAGK